MLVGIDYELAYLIFVLCSNLLVDMVTSISGLSSEEDTPECTHSVATFDVAVIMSSTF